MILPGVIASSGGVASSYESIATASGTGSSGTITFSSIPSTFAHLQIRGITRDGAGNGILLRFNNSSASDYATHSVQGDGATATASGSTAQTYIYQGYGGYSGTYIPSTIIMDVLNYTSTNMNKTTRTLFGEDHNGGGYIIFYSGLWKPSTIAAINRIDLVNNGGNWATTTQFALYGVKA